MEEAAEIQAIIASVLESDGAAAESCYNRYKSVLTKYQEQPQLLDAYLEGIVQPLAKLLRKKALASTAQDTTGVQDICRLLHVLITVRGYKTVVRFFPHEAADLERVLQVLEMIASARAASDSSGSDSNIALWETQAVLLLWLSILVLIPFDLVILDSEVTDDSSKAAAQQHYTPLAAKIMRLCQAYLQHPGAVREMAALLLARLLTRPDMSAALSDFMQWQQQALASVTGPAAVFLLPGVLHTLALIYKIGRRDQLLAIAPQLYHQVASLLGEVSAGLASNALARKLAVKLAQRIGLVLLPPQLAGWRYVKAAADLSQNLAASASQLDSTAATTTAATGQAEQQEDIEVPEEVEDLIGVLLSSCCDRDTIVRWSAAKGIGRLAGCLPLELAEEVVEGTLGLLSPSEPDTSWHGGCLAIADLARRSILSPTRLPALTALLQQALAYDVRRGPCSVGAHVRDAAAYVCWALARAYEPHQLADCVSAIAASLLVMACYDREINCRRAAASAFQECVGRLGSFPHGLEILAVADYFSVGNVASAYLRVAPFVAGFDEYKMPLLEHLVAVKLRHWDKALRSLAAMGLAALAPVASEQLATQALPQLLALVTNDVLEVRTGAVLAIAELLPALPAAGYSCSPNTDGMDNSSRGSCLQATTAAGVVGVLSQLESAALYRGKGGELMRESASRLVEQVAVAVAGLDVVPLVSFGPSKRHQAEQGMQHQESVRQNSSRSSSRSADATADMQDDYDAAADLQLDSPNATGRGANFMQQQLHLPLTPEYHTSALRLIVDCLGHVQNSIQASGVAALKAHARAFQAHPEHRQQLLSLVNQLCSRVADAAVLPAARRGAAAGLGVLPAGLVAQQAEHVLDKLATAAQVPSDSQSGFEVETRIAAVSALAQLTQELLQVPTPVQTAATATAEEHCSSSPSPAIALDVLTGCVCPALLAASEDYTRDNRGDVGSWVREAAMDGLAQVVLALGHLSKQQKQLQQTTPPENEHQEEQQTEDAAVILSQGVASLRMQQQHQHGGLVQHSSSSTDTAATWSACTVAQLHRRLALLVISGLLRQSVERIARLREAALIQLRALLTYHTTAVAVPGAADILAALPGDAVELAGIASLAGIGKLAALLKLPWYRLPLLEGLVACIGGVDASLAKAASQALLAQLDSSSSTAATAAVATGGAATEMAQKGVQEDVAKLLVQLWQQHAGSVRLSLPLIKAAALLITHAGFADVAVPAVCSTADTEKNTDNVATDACIASSGNIWSFAWSVLQLLKQDLRGCSDVGKLLEGAALMAQLACIPDCSASAIQSVMVLLVNRFPKVRRHMAEELYLHMLAVQADVDAADGTGNHTQSIFAAVSAEDLESALDVLLISPWDGSLDQARAGREELAKCLQIEIKTRRVARASDGRSAAAPPEGARSAEHESYQSLLDDAARGGGY